MKRFMLTTTAALTLSVPAFAQSQTETAVMNALVENGYEASAINALSDTEVSELYTAASGGDQTEVNRVIETLSFGMADDTLDVTTSADRFVAASLQSRGVDATIVNGLSQAEMSDLYIALTSGDETEIERRLSTLES